MLAYGGLMSGSGELPLPPDGPATPPGPTDTYADVGAFPPHPGHGFALGYLCLASIIRITLNPRCVATYTQPVSGSAAAPPGMLAPPLAPGATNAPRSEEHTSELQSRLHLV